MARIREVAAQMKMTKCEPTDHHADASETTDPTGRNDEENNNTPSSSSASCTSASSSNVTNSSSMQRIQIDKLDGDNQQPRGVTQAPTLKASKRAPKKMGPCHFGCLTTAQSNWESSPSGSSWWGTPSGSALCHAHYLRGWRYSGKHGHDPPIYDAPHLL